LSLGASYKYLYLLTYLVTYSRVAVAGYTWLRRSLSVCLCRTRLVFRHWKVMHRTSPVWRFIPSYQSFSLALKTVRFLIYTLVWLTVDVGSLLQTQECFFAP